MRPTKIWILFVLLAGCQQDSEERLVGTWVGRPEAPAERVSRQSPFLEVDTSRDDKTTDLEAYDITITMELRNDQTGRMWRDDHQEELSCRWELLDAVGNSMRIEMAAGESFEAAENQAGDVVLRRFELQWDADGTGFSLSEEGADPQFGSLHFVPGKE